MTLLSPVVCTPPYQRAGSIRCSFEGKKVEWIDWSDIEPKKNMPTKVPVIQRPPVLLDRKRSIAQALTSIDERSQKLLPPVTFTD